MALPKENKDLGLPADQQLAGDYLRLVETGQSILGISTIDENEVVVLARQTAGRMASLPSDVRLADRNDLISLFDEVKDVIGRLGDEQTLVKEKLANRARHDVARQAYQRGNPR